MPSQATLSTLIRQIKNRRLSKGISQSELGKLAGMPQSQIARIENGGGDVRLSTFLEIARALDYEPVLVPKRLLPAITEVIARASSDSRQKSSTITRLVGNEPEDPENE
jgi:transcriptional regulator with XRE-family HTH domain